MKIRDIAEFLETVAPAALQESYDNSGLLTGNPEKQVRGALITIDCTEEVVAEAVRKKCGLIISHHPIIFHPVRRLTGSSYIERTLINAIKNDVAIYSIHTNLDNVQNGVNRMICEKLGLINCKILSPKGNILKKLYTFCPHNKAEKVRKALFAAGAGVIGDYDECSFNAEGFGTFRGNESTNPFVGSKGSQHHEPETKIETIFPAYFEKQVIAALLNAHPYEEVAYDIVSLDNSHPRIGAGMIGELSAAEDEMNFLRKVKKRMKTGCIRYSPLTGRKVKKVAVCGGAGSFLLKNAIDAGADAFVTSDFTYHRFFDAEAKIIIADIGHFESEQFTKELLFSHLSEKFPTFAFYSADTNTNPIKYL